MDSVESKLPSLEESSYSVPEDSLFPGGTLRAVTGPTIRPGGLALTDRGVELACFAPDARVLDVGCGPGASVAHLSDVYRLRAVGVDRSAALLSEARGDGNALPFCRAQAFNLPFADAVFDGVLCECVLTLTDDPAAVLDEFLRVLKDGGHLVLTDMYLRSPAKAERLRSLPPESCLRGARNEEETLALVQAAGFAPLAWEDHTPLLRELAVRLIFAGNSESVGCGTGFNLPGLRPGYYLLVARKRTRGIAKTA